MFKKIEYAKEILFNMKNLISDDPSFGGSSYFFEHELDILEADMFLSLLDCPGYRLRRGREDGTSLVIDHEYGPFYYDYYLVNRNNYNYKFVLPSVNDVIKVIDKIEKWFGEIEEEMLA